MTLETLNPKSGKSEDRRAEYVALRAEILQGDSICLALMGALIAATATLYSKDNKLEWLVSLLAFISLCYFTEKRFITRRIAKFIQEEVCGEDSGFEWESWVKRNRENRDLRPLNSLLRPYNIEIITCSVIALSPMFVGMLTDLAQGAPKALFWLLFAAMTVVIAILNGLKYNRA
jgi:hypothetical protein